MAFADEHKMTYVPSKFEAVMPESSPHKLHLWSNLFSGEFSVPTQLPDRLKADSIRKQFVFLLKSWILRRPVLLDVGHCHAFTNIYPEAIQRSLALHKLKYNNPAGFADQLDGPAAVAVHVRRSLGFDTNFTPNRLTSDDQVLSHIAHVVQHTGMVSGVVFSGIPIPSLESRIPPGFDFDSDSDEFAVLHRLINANALIMAKSCLSYIAGTFALGAVFYDEFFHPPLPGWIVLS